MPTKETERLNADTVVKSDAEKKRDGVYRDKVEAAWVYSVVPFFRTVKKTTYLKL